MSYLSLAVPHSFKNPIFPEKIEMHISSHIQAGLQEPISPHFMENVFMTNATFFIRKLSFLQLESSMDALTEYPFQHVCGHISDERIFLEFQIWRLADDTEFTRRRDNSN